MSVRIPFFAMFTAGLLVSGGLVLTLPACGEPTVTASTPPGSDALTMDPALARALHSAMDRRHASGIDPRTRHRHEDGRPKYTNRLIRSSSPYLLQHAHNPVNWFPWGDEAFELAKKLNRPVFLSVGYATCHWCHVMEEESFEDPEIAAYLNAHFIPIKVDRETRPDVDAIYMTAVNAIHKRGGWPMSVWLNPDRQPFFAATYIPARDGDRGTRTGFLTFLENIVATWENDPSEIESTAARLTKHIQENRKPPPGSGLPTQAVEDALVTWAQGAVDPEHGGRKGRPKFWSSFPVRALIAAADRGDEGAAALVLPTLDKMAAGGVYDQVGGGFHRYSVDPAWGVPHFEKMLYDNAQLARIYGEAFQFSRDFRYAAIVDETLGFMIRELGVDGGGFASALDADSLTPSGELEEGWFYTWTPTELETLGAGAPSFREAYGVTDAGQLEGRNVLHFPTPPTLDHRRRFAEARLALQLERRKRPAPLRDDKVVTAWNGLAIGALAYNGALLGRKDWIEEARVAAQRLLENRVDGRLARTDGANGPEGVAFLDDYVFLAEALITLYESTGETEWLREAMALIEVARTFYKSPSGAWFSTPSDHEKLLVRDTPTHDGAMPSANTVLIGVLNRLTAFTSDDRFREEADAIASALPIAKAPQAFPEAVLGLSGRFRPLHEVVLVSPEGQRSADLIAAIRTIPPSARVLMPVTANDPSASALLPSVKGKEPLDGKPTAYVCHGGVCDRPTTDPAVLAELLAPR